jgi:hypothetical protein
MEVISNPRNIEPGAFAETAVTIGVFDGIHRGHTEVIRNLAAAKRAGGLRASILLTFDSHPLAVTHPEMAAAGLWTTPTDLARFLIAVQGALHGRSAVLSAGMARQMVTVQKGSHGLGPSLEGAGPAASFGHGGSNVGFKCGMTATVDGGRGAVVMANGDQGGRLASEILRAVAAEYGWQTRQPRQKTVVTVDPAALAALTGRYELRPGRVLTVALEGGTLFVLDGQERVELFPESPTRFFELVEEHELEFVKGPDGAVIHMLIDGVQPAKRVG